MRQVYSGSGFVALLLVLAGCGGGGGDGPTAAPQACVPVRPVTVGLYGDSTQVGWSITQLEPNNPRDALQAYFTAKYGAGAVIVSSRAVSGSTSQELPPLTGDVVVINSGINDMVRYGGPRFAEYAATLQTLAKAPTIVIFETQNVTVGWDGAPYAQTMREVAAQNGLAVADVYAFTEDKAALLSDWAHPTNELYGLISTVLQPVVARAVSKLRCE